MQLPVVSSFLACTLTVIGLLECGHGVRTAMIPRASSARDASSSSLDAKEHPHANPPRPLPPHSLTFLSVEILSSSNHSVSHLHSLYTTQNPPLFNANAFLLSSPNFSFVDGHKTRHFNVTPIVLSSMSEASINSANNDKGLNPSRVGAKNTKATLQIYFVNKQPIKEAAAILAALDVSMDGMETNGDEGRQWSSRNGSGVVAGEGLLLLVISLAAGHRREELTVLRMVVRHGQISLSDVAEPMVGATTWVLLAIGLMMLLVVGGMCWIIGGDSSEQAGERAGRMMVDYIRPFRASSDVVSIQAGRRPLEGPADLPVLTSGRRPARPDPDETASINSPFTICRATKLSNLSSSPESSSRLIRLPNHAPFSPSPTSASPTTVPPLSPLTISTIHTPSSQSLAFSDYHPLPSLPKHCKTT